MRKSSGVTAISVRHTMQARLLVVVSKALYIVPSIKNIRRFINASWRKESLCAPKRAEAGINAQERYHLKKREATCSKPVLPATVILGTVGSQFRLAGIGSLRAIVRIKGK